ncbi:MAG: DUF6516 family protein [Nitrospinales bacterium]
MSYQGRDRSLDTLLELDGQVLVVDPAGKHWVKFSVKQVNPSSEKPHGLNYSLTLHDEAGRRLVGFDNAHAVWSGSGPGKWVRKRYDHKHRLRRIKPYDYTSAAALLADFWDEVDAVLKEKGIIG